MRPSRLSEAELAGLERDIPADAPASIRGDYPEWLQPQFERAFGARAGEEGAALARAGVGRSQGKHAEGDAREGAEGASRFDAAPTTHSPAGVRILQAAGPGRSPHVEAEPGHGKGWYEVQDEGSQLAALLSGAKPKTQIIDLCAGAGGKTLALAALMENTGQLYAYDSDRMRLRPIFERLKRAGVRNAQVLAARRQDRLGRARRQDGPRADRCALHRLGGVAAAPRRRNGGSARKCSRRGSRSSAPCSRRGRLLVKPGGRLAYITCSVLPSENRDQVDAFLARHPEFKLIAWRQLWDKALPESPALVSADGADDTLLMTPRSHGTDGFFVAVLERQP